VSNPLDQASVEALLAQLATRTDSLTFRVTQSTGTRYRFASSRNVAAAAAEALKPGALDTPVLFMFSTRYRNVPFRGWLVSTAVHATEATGLLAYAAQAEMDAYDLRYPTSGEALAIPTVAPYGNTSGMR
jgi:hypothetical protein